MAKQTDSWTRFVTDIQEVASGRRGWTAASKTRARKLGIAHANLTVAAEALGLKIERAGRYGYVAVRRAA